MPGRGEAYIPTNIPLSWKTISDYEVKQDQAVPDLATNLKRIDSPSSLPAVTPDRRPKYPWSSRKLETGGVAGAFPRYGASVNQDCSNEGDIYIKGGLVNGKIVKGDIWLIRTSQEENFHCIPVSSTIENPGPRVGAAGVLAGNAFVVFGGDTKLEDNGTLDKTL